MKAFSLWRNVNIGIGDADVALAPEGDFSEAEAVVIDRFEPSMDGTISVDRDGLKWIEWESKRWLPFEIRTFALCGRCADVKNGEVVMTTTCDEYPFCSGCERYGRLEDGDLYEFGVAFIDEDECDCEHGRVSHHSGGNYHHTRWLVVTGGILPDPFGEDAEPAEPA